MKNAETIIKEHLYKNLKSNYNYTLAELRNRIGFKRMDARTKDYFTVSIVRQMQKDGKLARVEIADRVFYVKQ